MQMYHIADIDINGFLFITENELDVDICTNKVYNSCKVQALHKFSKDEITGADA
jgi:hypothetical protein